jgi:hypothetical protein
MRRMMLIAASWPSNRDAALTNRSGPRAAAAAFSMRSAGLLIGVLQREAMTV